MMDAPADERMDGFISVFNGHTNDADKRARKAMTRGSCMIEAAGFINAAERIDPGMLLGLDFDRMQLRRYDVGAAGLSWGAAVRTIRCGERLIFDTYNRSITDLSGCQVNAFG